MSNRYTIHTNIIASNIDTTNLTSTGLANLTGTNITGDIQFNSNSGSVGQTIVKTGPSTQTWGLLPPVGIEPGSANQFFTMNGAGTEPQWTTSTSRYLFATTSFTTQNWNTSTIGIDLVFTGTCVSEKFGVAPLSNLTYGTNGLGQSEITVGTSAVYYFDLAASLTNSTGGTAQVFLSVFINDVDINTRIYSNILPSTPGLVNTVVGRFSLSLNAGDTIRFRASRNSTVTSTSTLICDPLNSFMYITISDTTIN